MKISPIYIRAVENDLPYSPANQINCVLTGTETCSKAESEFVKNECVNGIHSTAKLIDFECHMTAPEIRLVLTIGFDPGGYFLCGLNLF